MSRGLGKMQSNLLTTIQMHGAPMTFEAIRATVREGAGLAGWRQTAAGVRALAASSLAWADRVVSSDRDRRRRDGRAISLFHPSSGDWHDGRRADGAGAAKGA